jgi:hypothetical protein
MPVRSLANHSHAPIESRHYTARLLAILGVFVGMFGFGGNPATAQGAVTDTTSYTYVMAEGTLCTDDGACGAVIVEVGPGKFDDGPVLCLGLDGPEIYGSACADVSAVFAIDGQHLTYADLPLTTLTFTIQECDKEGNCSDPTYRDVTVSASWTAAGDRQPVQENLGNPHGPCTSVDIVHGFFQPAAVSLVVDGQQVEASGNLQSITVHGVTRTNCVPGGI